MRVYCSFCLLVHLAQLAKDFLLWRVSLGPRQLLAQHSGQQQQQKQSQEIDRRFVNRNEISRLDGAHRFSLLIGSRNMSLTLSERVRWGIISRVIQKSDCFWSNSSSKEVFIKTTRHFIYVYFVLKSRGVNTLLAMGLSEVFFLVVHL